MNIENVLRYLVPDPKFHGRLFTPEDYDNIKWVDDRPKPTWIELSNASIEMAAAESAKAAQGATEKSHEDELRTKYDLRNLRGMKIKEIEAYVDTTLAEDNGVKKAIQQLTIAVALLARKIQ